MIDAFKTEYMQYATYLSSITKKNQWGELEMPVGHEGGMEIFFLGKSDKLALFYKKQNSSLRFVKYLSFLDKFGKIGRLIADSLINLPRYIRGYELFRTGKVPLNQLWKFEFSVSKPAYKIKGVKYIYFNDLDKIGHKYGTKSKEIIDAIRQIDEKISRMDFDIILSDHGMVDIKKTISVPLAENCFIDSDMARYWGSKEELERIKKELLLKEGKITDWKNKDYGELVFVANTGILISPNFWQGKTFIRAMHGYDGKDKEMRGVYILNKEGKKTNLKAEQLHEIFNKLREEKNVRRKQA